MTVFKTGDLVCGVGEAEVLEVSYNSLKVRIKSHPDPDVVGMIYTQKKSHFQKVEPVEDKSANEVWEELEAETIPQAISEPPKSRQDMLNEATKKESFQYPLITIRKEPVEKKSMWKRLSERLSKRV